MVIVLRYVQDKVKKVRQQGFKTWVFRFATKLPFVSGKIKAEGEKVLRDYVEIFSKNRKNTIKVLPTKPLPHDEIMKRIN
jgi:hypothetical protein